MANEKRLIYMDDTVDRLRAYADRKHQAGHTELANGILKAVNYIHNEISRVEAVEVVHGRWIEKGEQLSWCEDDVDIFWECSICECQNGVGLSPYCPNCGAKMDGDGNG